MKCSLGISNFLEEIASLSHSIVFLYFFALITEEVFLISPCHSLELCIQMGISFLFSFAFSLVATKLLSAYQWQMKWWHPDFILVSKQLLLTETLFCVSHKQVEWNNFAEVIITWIWNHPKHTQHCGKHINWKKGSWEQGWLDNLWGSMQSEKVRHLVQTSGEKLLEAAASTAGRGRCAVWEKETRDRIKVLKMGLADSRPLESRALFLGAASLLLSVLARRKHLLCYDEVSLLCPWSCLPFYWLL